jgi:hypothetical protein
MLGLQIAFDSGDFGVLERPVADDKAARLG